MKTLVFAPETINIAETTRMIEIAKASSAAFRCVFFGYSDAIVRQGSAIRIRKRRLSRHSLLGGIEQLVHDPSARQRAKEIQQMSQAWNGTQNAAQFLSRTFS
jgi:hypothetical protein